MAVENVKLMKGCFTEHMSMGIVKLKYVREPEKEGNPKRVKLEDVKWSLSKEAPKA